MATQAQTKRCDVCGGDARVTATANPREFDWCCVGCPNRWEGENNGGISD